MAFRLRHLNPVQHYFTQAQDTLIWFIQSEAVFSLQEISWETLNLCWKPGSKSSFWGNLLTPHKVPARGVVLYGSTATFGVGFASMKMPYFRQIVFAFVESLDLYHVINRCVVLYIPTTRWTGVKSLFVTKSDFTRSYVARSYVSRLLWFIPLVFRLWWKLQANIGNGESLLVPDTFGENVDIKQSTLWVRLHHNQMR